MVVAERGAVMATLNDGIDRPPSRYSVEETVSRTVTLIQQKGMKLFALVDHS